MSKVIAVADAAVRENIENFITQHTFPDVIKFAQDGLGNWVTSVENLQGARYTVSRQDFNDYLNANGIITNVMSVKEALETWGLVIDYVAPLETGL